MLGPLIDKLEFIEDKLKKIKNEGSLIEKCSSNEWSRNLINTVKILSCLVLKSTQNKNYDDDIASCHNTSYNPFSNLRSSEEFLNEVKNMLQTKPEFNGDIHSYLINFQELVGDLVFSICEISNSEMQLASGIKVKDLLRIKNLYSKLGELLSLLFHPNALNQKNATTTQREQTEKNPPKPNSVVLDLVNAIESCLKEMSKVKLDIEHYIKCNMIEMQFTKTEDTGECNIPEEKIKNKAEVYFKSEDYALNCSSDFFPQMFPESEHVFQSAFCNVSSSQSGPQENYLEACMFPQNMAGWDNCYENYTIVQDSYGNIFNGQIIYPPEVLFFEPPTMVFQSQTRKNSLPKIYSVNSINDDPTKLSRENINNNKEQKQQKKNLPEDFSDTKENIKRKLLFDNTEEDLFFDNPNNNINESEYVQLKKKISSLLTLLKTKQMSNMDDIFEINPSKLETGSSPRFHKQKGSTKTKSKKKSAKGKYFSNNMANLLLKQENQEKKKSNVNRKNQKLFCQNQSQTAACEGLNPERVIMEYPMEFRAPSESEVIYDRRSVIELFKSNPKECCNAESVPTQESSFCLWPVMADYIYVSKSDRTENCHSVPSANSITLGKGFEKSFYTLQINKKYEQNHFYDGDIIVLNPSETEKVHNKRISTYSLLNSQTISYDEHEVNKNNVKPLHPLNSDNKSEFKNKQNMFFNNSLVSNEQGLQTQKRSYAVHYADCADSFIMGNNYKKEKINFFNFNSYEESHNWDSFISIITSKVGPQTQINEQRMFRKIVKNMGAESLHNNNIFENVHTLTSSGGPFRLFDINGYPLTDSEGNVLKDPYGKCLVKLDSTGLPKDDIKVFDAAGNLPKDVKFDPTQKPQTNCVVVKLTDNFKRPLHLFDKYGRPLTDSGGKLLVNIHGRPLLRFDNFGRPNTDYRGGPLYTDNGFRWSFKAQTHSKEQLSNENLITQNKNVKNELEWDKSICTDSTVENPKSFSDNCSPDPLDKFAHTNSRNSEIWKKVENVLLQHSKKTKLEIKTFQTEELENKFLVGVNKNLAEKHYLDSTIDHTAASRDATNNLNRDNHQEVKIYSQEDDYRVENKGVSYECNSLMDTTIDCGLKNDILNEATTANMPIQFYEKYLTNKKFQSEQDHCTPCIFLGTENVCRDPEFLINGNILRKIPLTSTLPHHQTDFTNIVPSILTIKNHHYLNNLCNQILKNNIESRVMQKDTKYKNNNLRLWPGEKKNNLTDKTLSDFTSSFASKYTNDIPLYTDSPAVSTDSDKRDPQIAKILESIDLKFRKHGDVKLKNKQSYDSRNLKDIQVNFKDKVKDKPAYQNIKKVNDQSYDDQYKEFTKSGTSEETTTYIDITNKRSNQYQINVKERIRTGFQPHEESRIVDLKSPCESMNVCEPPQHETDYPERENDSQVVKHSESTRHACTTPSNCPPVVYHGQYCRHFKHEKSKISDSPFRFPSAEKIENSMNSKTEYVDCKNWMGPNWNKSSQKLEKRKSNEFINHQHFAHQHDHVYSKIDKKPQRNGRDCNLVSFLGTPVKYVWNKLDNKLSMRQTAKENKYKQLNTIYEPNEIKFKTLYAKGNQKSLASTETCTKNKRGKKHRKKGDTLLALKSKSFSEITSNKEECMSYSGSQETTGKHSPESSSQYKCSSDTIVSTHKHPQRKSRRCDMKNQKKEQYSFETHYVHTTNTTNNRHSRGDRSSRGYNKHISKSPKKSKPSKLFKKSGH